MLSKDTAEISGRRKAAFVADCFGGFSCGKKKLPGFFDAVIQKIADWRLIPIGLEAAGGFASADVCRSGNVPQSDRSGKAFMDEIQHFLHADLKRVLIFSQ